MNEVQLKEYVDRMVGCERELREEQFRSSEKALHLAREADYRRQDSRMWQVTALLALLSLVLGVIVFIARK